MKRPFTAKLAPANWLVAFLLLIVCGGFQPAVSASETAPIDSVRREIRQLVQRKEFEQVAKAYDHLGWLYHQQYGYNKHSIEAYFNGLKYYGLLGDSLGYYSEYIVIGDYYTHDFFMQDTPKSTSGKRSSFLSVHTICPK